MSTQVYFNGVNLLQDFLITNVDRPFPMRTALLQEVPGRDGSVFQRADYGPLEIVMTLNTVGGTKAQRREAMHNLTALLNVTEPKPLRFTDDPEGLYYLAIPSENAARKQYFTAESMTVKFVVPDPVMYGASQTETMTSGTKAIEVDGTYPAAPVISSTNAVRDSTSHVWGVAMEDGSYIHVSLPDGNAHSVEINTLTRVTKVDGVVTLPTLQSNWIRFEPGSHTLTRVGTGTVNIAYVERWL